MRPSLLVLFLIIAVGCVGDLRKQNQIDNKRNVNASEIIDEIQKRGAKAVVKAFYENCDLWNELLRRIASGEREWIEVAIYLKPGADAGASEMLNFAVGEAIENAPETVLKAAVENYDLKEICCGPDVDDARYSTYSKALATTKRRIEALQKVEDEALQQNRDKCIGNLQEAISRLRRFFENE